MVFDGLSKATWKLQTAWDPWEPQTSAPNPPRKCAQISRRLLESHAALEPLTNITERGFVVIFANSKKFCKR